MMIYLVSTSFEKRFWSPRAIQSSWDYDWVDDMNLGFSSSGGYWLSGAMKRSWLTLHRPYTDLTHVRLWLGNPMIRNLHTIWGWLLPPIWWFWQWFTGWWFGTWLLFSISYVGCHPSHWLSYFSRWLEPPSSLPLGLPHCFWFGFLKVPSTKMGALQSPHEQRRVELSGTYLQRYQTKMACALCLLGRPFFLAVFALHCRLWQYSPSNDGIWSCWLDEWPWLVIHWLRTPDLNFIAIDLAWKRFCGQPWPARVYGI